MAEYIIAYHGGEKPSSPEEGAKQMADFMTWLKDLGDAVINPGTPLSSSKLVSAESVSDHTGPERLTGFSTISADNIEAAVKIAKSCPFLEMGTIEVAEVMKM